jgi:hypothetical protein
MSHVQYPTLHATINANANANTNAKHIFFSTLLTRGTFYQLLYLQRSVQRSSRQPLSTQSSTYLYVFPIRGALAYITAQHGVNRTCHVQR